MVRIVLYFVDALARQTQNPGFHVSPGNEKRDCFGRLSAVLASVRQSLLKLSFPLSHLFRVGVNRHHKDRPAMPDVASIVSDFIGIVFTNVLLRRTSAPGGELLPYGAGTVPFPLARTDERSCIG